MILTFHTKFYLTSPPNRIVTNNIFVTGERSPTLSETATTARASSINENGGTLNKVHNFDNNANNATVARNTQTLNRRTNNNHPLNNSLGTLPRVNNSVAGGLLAATLGRKINTGNHKKKQTQPIMAYDEIPGLQRYGTFNISRI